ncbi:HET-domain-containing protein, partial [Lophium mytilinum]
MADLPPYLYKPLQSETSIRIMILLPAKDEKDPLECRLENADIGDPRPYYGVSYVWGDESHPSRIQCEGAHISITRNADIALRHIRRATKDVPLWIDSISINQKDVDERNAQVRIMGDIYRKSKMVFIWLGSADEFESTAAALE